MTDPNNLTREQRLMVEHGDLAAATSCLRAAIRSDDLDTATYAANLLVVSGFDNWEEPLAYYHSLVSRLEENESGRNKIPQDCANLCNWIARMAGTSCPSLSVLSLWNRAINCWWPYDQHAYDERHLNLLFKWYSYWDWLLDNKTTYMICRSDNIIPIDSITLAGWAIKPGSTDVYAMITEGFHPSANLIQYKYPLPHVPSCICWTLESNGEGKCPTKRSLRGWFLSHNQLGGCKTCGGTGLCPRCIDHPCICPTSCDCENPDGVGVRHISNFCPIHNDDPEPNPDCPSSVHKNTRTDRNR